MDKNFFKQNNKLKEILLVFLIGSMLFFLIYGINAFKIFPQPFNDNDYLLYQASYYAFIDSDFNFPIFNSDKLFVNQEINLIFADYIPIYSLLLKILNKTFNLFVLNPFMIWIYLNIILIFYFSYKIFSLSRKLNFYDLILGSTIMATLPLSPFKFLYHSGEGSHFVIIASIYLYFKSRENQNYLYYLAILTSLSLWIHLYLFAILFGIFFISLFNYFKNIKVLLSTSLIFTILTSTIFFLSFQSINLFLDSLKNNVLTQYNPRWGAEFNSFFCSYNNPKFLEELLRCYEPYTLRDVESYAYLGLGVILFLPIVLFNFKNSYFILKSNKSLISLSIIFLLFSFGNRIKIAHKQIYEYKFTELHLKLIEIFRAHGRFVYLFYYLIVFFTIYKLFIIRNKTIKILLLCIFLFIQSFDLIRQYSTTDLNLFRVSASSNEILELSKSSIKNLEYRLFIYPPDNCIENYDMYLFAKEFIKYGGSISSSRIRGGGSYKNCENITIKNNLFNYSPEHFIISNSVYIQIKDLLANKYTCISATGVFKNEIIYYCEV